MLTYMDMRLLVVTGMVIVMIVFFAYSYHRDQAAQSKRLVRIPVRTRDQRGRPAPVPEEETSEIAPAYYYIGFLFAAYLIAMLILAG